jgi:hypothetical protein
MTCRLFSSWISHFVKSLETQGGISPTNRHLLILDGHGSHMTLEVVYKAMQIGLDLLTLPSHTSHRLQPLDVSFFIPFNCTFRRYRDAWTLHHRGQPAQKEDLAQWVDLALKQALSPVNITRGFMAMGIWPLNPVAMQGKMGPNAQFLSGLPNYNADRNDPNFYRFSNSDEEGDRGVPNHGEEDLHCDSDGEGDTDLSRPIPRDDPGLQTLLDERVLSSQPNQQHYFIAEGDDDEGTIGNSNAADDGPDEVPDAERHHNGGRLHRGSGDIGSWL